MEKPPDVSEEVIERLAIWDPSCPAAYLVQVPYCSHLLPAQAGGADGRVPTNADQTWDQNTGTPEVSYQFDRQGAAISERLTGDNIGRKMAIILDDRVKTAPVHQEPHRRRAAASRWAATAIPFQLQEEAKDLVAVLRSGALPAPLTKSFETQVGPTMGRDAVHKAKLAMGDRRAAVIIFMLIYYRVSGLIANLAMVLNILYLLAILAGFEATLTLPGIAGLVLTVGMAVDANIIIYERIREELRRANRRADGRRRRLRARVLDGVRRARHQLRRGHRPLLVRHGPDPRLRRDADGRHHHQPVHLVLGVALDVRRRSSDAARRGHAVHLGNHGGPEPRPEVLRGHQAGLELRVHRPAEVWIGLSIVLIAADGRDAADQPLRHQGPRAHAQLGHRLPRRHRDPVEFARAVDASEIREALRRAGFHDADVVELRGPDRPKPWTTCSASAPSRSLSDKQAEADPRTSWPRSARRRSSEFDWTEGGDKIYLRYDKPVEPPTLQNSLKAIGVNADAVQPLRPRRRQHLRGDAGQPGQRDHGARWTRSSARARWRRSRRSNRSAPRRAVELRDDGIKSLLFAILLIMVYIAFRFDFRYGPGTVVALLHDAVLDDRRVRDHLQGVLADDGRGDPDRS